MVCTTYIDNIGVYDPDNNNLIEIPVPTETSFIQFMTSDGNDNVWFVEQQANKIGTIKITEIPVIASQIQTTNNFELKYTRDCITTNCIRNYCNIIILCKKHTR